MHNLNQLKLFLPVLRRLPLLLFISGLYACKCGDVTCPALEPQYTAWVPYKPGEVVKYINSAGQEIQFTVTDYQESVAKNLDCGPNGYGGCKCPDCPAPSSGATAQTTDTARKIVAANGQTVKIFRSLFTTVGKPNDSTYLGYNVFDHGNSIKLAPVFALNPTDSLLNSYTVGNRTYSNVIVHQVDTTSRPYANPIYNVYFVWKSYYNKEFGVIAFYDLKTRSLFYRKP